MTRTAVALVLLVVATACGGGVQPGGSDDVVLGGGTWVFTDGSVDGRALTVPDGARVSLTVEGDQVGGVAACNSYGGSIDVDGDRIVVGQLAVTEMACQQALMAAESTFLRGIQQVTTASRQGDVLELTGARVTLTFELSPPVPAQDLVGTIWHLDSLVTGDAVSSVAGDPATLLLRADGTFTGGTGCRGLAGRYVLHGDEVEAVELSADGECPAALRDQDSHVTGVLEGGFRVAVDGARLTLTSDGGDGLGYRAGEDAPS